MRRRGGTSEAAMWRVSFSMAGGLAQRRVRPFSAHALYIEDAARSNAGVGGRETCDRFWSPLNHQREVGGCFKTSAGKRDTLFNALVL